MTPQQTTATSFLKDVGELIQKHPDFGTCQPKVSTVKAKALLFRTWNIRKYGSRIVNFVFYADLLNNPDKLICILQNGSALRYRNFGNKSYIELCRAIGIKKNASRHQCKKIAVEMFYDPKIKKWALCIVNQWFNKLVKRDDFEEMLCDLIKMKIAGHGPCSGKANTIT